MCTLQVLVTTMHQTDFSKYYEMNLQTDAIIANQADKTETIEKSIGNCNVRLVTTNTRGLSKNRNIAIENSFASDLILFSDDDLSFHFGYMDTILKVFRNHPEADAIKFNLNCISEKKISMKPITLFHRVSRREVSSWGVCGLVIRKKVILNKGLHFNERFGTGTANYCGEDTIFLQDLFKKKIKVYASPEYIAVIDQSESTWNEGHNERYFTTGGMIINECYPFLCYLIVLRSAFRATKRNDSEFSFWQILKCYYRGIQKNRSER